MPEGNSVSLPSIISTIAKENKIEVIHSHNWGVFIECALACKRLTKAVMVHTVHGPYIQYDSGWVSYLKKILRHMAERFVARYVCKIVIVSDSIRSYIQSEIGLPLEKIITVHNGTADSFQDHTDRTIGDKIKFITVGRVAPIKNHQMMLKAFAKVKQKGKQFELTVVGDGPELKNLQQLALSLEIVDQVKFTGFRKDINEILQVHDVFLLSSDYEGISIALLESMSFSLPAIVTNVGGVPETVINNETAYLVDAGDVDDFADKICFFIDTPSSVRVMGEKAREYFCSEFHENVVINRYQEIYRNCISDR
jgi:glycosyltransferase involved in cell wall biosynthesis